MIWKPVVLSDCASFAPGVRDAACDMGGILILANGLMGAAVPWADIDDPGVAIGRGGLKSKPLACGSCSAGAEIAGFDGFETPEKTPLAVDFESSLGARGELVVGDIDKPGKRLLEEPDCCAADAGCEILENRLLLPVDTSVPVKAGAGVDGG